MEKSVFRCWEADNQTRELYMSARPCHPNECAPVQLIGSRTTKRKSQEREVELGIFPLSHTREAGKNKLMFRWEVTPLIVLKAVVDPRLSTQKIRCKTHEP